MIANLLVNEIKEALIEVGKWILQGIIGSSYLICLTACLLALILYVAGMKKAGKYVSISFIIYFLIQAVSLVL